MPGFAPAVPVILPAVGAAKAIAGSAAWRQPPARRAAAKAMRAITLARFGIAALVCLLPASPATSVDAVRLRPGLYEVGVRLDLPNIAGAAVSKVAMICLPAEDSAGNHGLVALSDNNPLAHCPVVNVRQEGDALTFDIVCPGGNAAIASAKYLLTADTFAGRITMKLGGKNMTMTETQSGRRTGDCRS
ncbi:MAG: DUF3617 family protein [Hyphomicrobiaceae bacterium]